LRFWNVLAYEKEKRMHVKNVTLCSAATTVNGM